MAFTKRQIKAIKTLCCTDVNATLYKRHVPAGYR